ncbi:MAG: MFS transporter [Candidatus Rokubacteria bacterium]|nr:MFS transporter [Candidatus Rokubacteria bacterium]
MGTEPTHAARVSLGVACVTLAISYGVWYAYSVFLVALLREFGWSRSTVAGAFAAFTLVHGAWNPVVGWLTDRWGPRRVVAAGGIVLALGLAADGQIDRPWHLYVLFGGLTAIGVSTAGWTPAVVLVQRNFGAHLGLALGIAGSGIGMGIFLVVPACQALIDAFGWRWAFRALSVLAAVWIVPATWLATRDDAPVRAAERSVRTPAVAVSDGAGDLALRAALLTSPFWLIAGAKFLGNIATQSLLVHQAAYLVDQGIAPMIAASAISLVGIASIVGKTGGGWLSDHVDREIVYVLGMAFVIASIVVLRMAALSPSYWAAYGYAILIGLGYSVTASLIPAILSDRFRGAHFGAIFGVAQVGSAIGSGLGAWLAGRLFDVTGSYAIALGMAAATAIVAAALIWIARATRIRTVRFRATRRP